jgi:hypothetical protein
MEEKKKFCPVPFLKQHFLRKKGSVPHQMKMSLLEKK